MQRAIAIRLSLAVRVLASLGLPFLVLALLPEGRWLASLMLVAGGPFMALAVLTCLSIPLTIERRPLIWSALAVIFSVIAAAAVARAAGAVYCLLIALPSAGTFVAISKLPPFDRRNTSKAYKQG
jgi:hypothetical protein